LARSSGNTLICCKHADAIFIDELRAAGWYEKNGAGVRRVPSSAFGGRDGDGRTYEYVVALRAVQTVDS
jgi:GMP synthase (glutamine-hydrolysing)